MTSSRLRFVTLAVAVTVGVGLLGPRARVDVGLVHPVDVPEDVGRYLAASEAAVQGIRPGDQKRVVWADPDAPSPTPLVVVYLHGFSADPHELDPVPQRLADSLGANLFVTRLAGHGLEPGLGLGGATAEAWLQDTEEALAVGEGLGDRIVLVGTSTGGTLATWAALGSTRRDRLAALVLVSPNFGLRDKRADMLLWPWGGVLARLTVGEERCWTPVNPEQERHWTTCYPTRALLSMRALVETVRDADLSRVAVPTLVLLSPDDQVVDPEETRDRIALFGVPVRTVEVHDDQDPAHHVLAGDVVSPGSTDHVLSEMLSFLRQRASIQEPIGSIP